MRRFGGSMGLVAAMENDKPKGDDKEPLGENAESLETDLAEVGDSEAEGAEHQAATDEAEETAEALEGFRVALEGIQGNGGLDANGAMMMHLAVQHFDKRMGMTGHTLPALENFGGQTSRVQAGTIALEELKDKIAEIWKAIVAAIKKFAAMMANYWNQVFGAAEKLDKRAKALAEKAKATTGAVKQKSFDNDRLANSLAIDNAPPTNVMAHAKDLKDVTSEIVTKGAQIAGSVGEKAVEALSELKGESIGPILGLLKPIGGEKVGDANAEGLAAASEGMTLYRTKQLFGGMAVLSRVPGETSGQNVEQQIKHIGETSYSVGKFNNKVKAPTNKSFTTLNTTDASSLATLVAEIATEMLAYRKNTPKLVELQKKLGDAAQKIADSAGKEEDEAKRKELSACQGIATNANRVLVQPGSAFMKYALGVSKNLLDYVELSLKQYA